MPIEYFLSHRQYIAVSHWLPCLKRSWVSVLTLKCFRMKELVFQTARPGSLGRKTAGKFSSAPSLLRSGQCWKWVAWPWHQYTLNLSVGTSQLERAELGNSGALFLYSPTSVSSLFLSSLVLSQNGEVLSAGWYYSCETERRKRSTQCIVPGIHWQHALEMQQLSVQSSQLGFLGPACPCLALLGSLLDSKMSDRLYFSCL